jgi:hypothetical protein
LFLRTASLAVCLSLAAGCGPTRGATDPVTNLVGLSTSKGSLAGTWAQVVVTATIVPIPVLGDQPGGGRSTRLVQRVWDAAAGHYTEEFVRCTNDIIDVEGEKTVVPQETIPKIAPVHYASTVDHAQGTYSTETIIDLWGVRNLPDPIETPLPTPDNYQAAPQSDWVWDEDGDGKPGVTIVMGGAVAGKVFVCKRTIYTFSGTVVGKDRVQGLVSTTKLESNSLDSTVSWLKGVGHSTADPDPRKSWFDEVRLKSGATCEDVAAVVSDGTLATNRPF